MRQIKASAVGQDAAEQAGRMHKEGIPAVTQAFPSDWIALGYPNGHDDSEPLPRKIIHLAHRRCPHGGGPRPTERLGHEDP